MNKSNILLLFLIVGVSACLGFPGNQALVSSPTIKSVENQDVFFNVEATPADIKVGKNVTLSLSLRNNAASNITDAKVLAFDQCLFSGETEKEFSSLRPNRTELWVWRWTAGTTEFPRDCQLSFRTEYSASTKLTSDIAVLSDAEFNARVQAGTLKDLPILLRKEDKPLSLSVAFSEQQPFLGNDVISIYIDYANTGAGIMNELNPGDIEIEIPANLQPTTPNIPECGTAYGFVNNNPNKLTLIKTLSFINNKAPRTTCTFKTNTSQPINIQTFQITANYKYMLDNSIVVKVLPIR